MFSSDLIGCFTVHPLHSLKHNIYFACFFTIPAEPLMVRLAAGLENGRVYANIEGITISDPDCYVTVGVMFCFAYFSVVFFIHKI